jgi:hypothetical protein
LSSNEREVNRFINAISLQRDAIASLKSSLFTENHQQTLFICLLDTMAKSVYANKNNQLRFKDFVKNFCEWPDCMRVSLPHLIELLKRVPQNELCDLRSYADEQYNKWQIGKATTLEADPMLEEVEELWPNSYIALNKIKAELLTHVNLLWRLRNSLVHESRPLGRGIDFFTLEEPYYVGRIDWGEDKYSEVNYVTGYVRELYYPTTFFIRLINNGLHKLKDYCADKEIDPLAPFRFDSLWLDFD